jgi:DNA-binding winged helix-turn-helix (wHTH) protein
VTVPLRFRFHQFVLSPRQRLLLREGTPVPLIPKYFDLLVLLIERRRDVVSKHVIFAEIWSDVVVSDGALSQAIRTLRRTLDDNSREPRFIRTVSRHGYQFVWPNIVEENDDGPFDFAQGRPLDSLRDKPQPLVNSSTPAHSVQTLEPLIDRLLADAAAGPEERDNAREAAERLHALGTAAALAELTARPHHARAVAIMRDARWSVPGAGPVPLDAGAAAALIRLRLSDARRTVTRRWAGAAAAGALGGLAAGLAGGIVLNLSPTSSADAQASMALGAIGALAGSVGAAAIGAGLAAAEVLARSRRGLALALCGALSGALVAAVAQIVTRALLDGLLGVRSTVVPGLIEGLVIGGGAGIGYAIATRQPPGGGIAAPTGSRRLAVAASVGGVTALGATVLALSGRAMIGGLVNEIARSSPDARLVLAPLGRLIGETDFGPVTRTLLSALEGGIFGFALGWGLTSRPSESRTSH